MLEDRANMQKECRKHNDCKTCPLLLADKKYKVITDGSYYTYTVTCAIKLDWMKEHYGEALEEV